MLCLICCVSYAVVDCGHVVATAVTRTDRAVDRAVVFKLLCGCSYCCCCSKMLLVLFDELLFV